MNIKQSITESVLTGAAPETERLVEQALHEGFTAEEVLKDALIPAMGEVGVRFEQGDYFVPEMLISARAMKAGLAHLQPLLVQQDVKPLGTVVIGTVKGDLHDIGKNLVAMMMEGAGCRVVDLGVDVPPERFVSAARENNADLLALSALLTTTMQSMSSTISALKDAGLYGKVKVMVGGAPLSQEYADQIGAHAFAPDASAAVTRAKILIDA